MVEDILKTKEYDEMWNGGTPRQLKRNKLRKRLRNMDMCLFANRSKTKYPYFLEDLQIYIWYKKENLKKIL